MLVIRNKGVLPGSDIDGCAVALITDLALRSFRIMEMTRNHYSLPP